jgi:hypothetical protein
MNGLIIDMNVSTKWRKAQTYIVVLIMCDLDLGYRELNFMHNIQPHSELCQVILKSFIHVVLDSVLQLALSMTVVFDIVTWLM